MFYPWLGKIRLTSPKFKTNILFFRFVSSLHDLQYHVFVFGTIFGFTHDRWYQLSQESHPTISHAFVTLQFDIQSFLTVSGGIFSIFAASFIFSFLCFLVNNYGKIISNQNKSHLLNISVINTFFLSMRIIKNHGCPNHKVTDFNFQGICFQLNLEIIMISLVIAWVIRNIKCLFMNLFLQWFLFQWQRTFHFQAAILAATTICHTVWGGSISWFFCGPKGSDIKVSVNHHIINAFTFKLTVFIWWDIFIFLLQVLHCLYPRPQLGRLT